MPTLNPPSVDRVLSMHRVAGAVGGIFRSSVLLPERRRGPSLLQVVDTDRTSGLVTNRLSGSRPGRGGRPSHERGSTTLRHRASSDERSFDQLAQLRRLDEYFIVAVRWSYSRRCSAHYSDGDVRS
jgi:hypothetical protein